MPLHTADPSALSAQQLNSTFCDKRFAEVVWAHSVSMSSTTHSFDTVMLQHQLSYAWCQLWRQLSPERGSTCAYFSLVPLHRRLSTAHQPFPTGSSVHCRHLWRQRSYGQECACSRSQLMLQKGCTVSARQVSFRTWQIVTYLAEC